MFITKTTPSITKNGVITPRVSVQDGTLIIDDEEKFKFEDGKWYCGNEGGWCWLGIEANPAYITDGKDIIDQELFDQVFEPIEKGE